MIVLYNPPSTRQHKPVMPLSLLALAAVLEKEHKYVIIDGNLESDPLRKLDRTFRSQQTKILGVTVMPGPQLSHAVPHCSELKRLHPGLDVVWGGYFPTQHYEAVLKESCVDYVIRGHGELVFKQLVKTLSGGGDPCKIPGLAYREPRSGEIRSNPKGPIPHPDRLPDFPYHRIEVSQYIRPTCMGNRTVAHHSSYGCPFLCNFCAVVNLVEGRWLAQSAKRTAQVVRNLVKDWRAEAVEFYDNNFLVQESRTAECAGRILDLQIAWWAEARIDTLLKYANQT